MVYCHLATVGGSCFGGQAMEEKPVQSDSFVIRVWREEGYPSWRGWIQHARSGESESIRDLEVAFSLT